MMFNLSTSCRTLARVISAFSILSIWTAATIEGGAIRYSLVEMTSEDAYDLDEHFRPAASGLTINRINTDYDVLDIRLNGETYPVTALGGPYFGIRSWNTSRQIVVIDSVDPNPGFFPLWRPILIEGGLARDIAPASYSNGLEATAINEKGQVVGGGHGGPTIANPGAFFYDGQSMTFLGTLPGGNRSLATDINESGVIVGWSNISASDQTSTAFVYDAGKMYNLNEVTSGIEGLKLTWPRAIRDDGWIWVLAHPIEGGISREFWLKPEEIQQIISDDAATPPDETLEESGAPTNESEIPMPEEPVNPPPASETGNPPTTTVDTGSEAWSQPTVDSGQSPTDSSGVPTGQIEPVPVPEPATLLVWVGAMAGWGVMVHRQSLRQARPR